MKLRIHILLAVVAAMLALSGACFAADPSFLGTSGNILTPDDTVLEVADFRAAFHSLDFDDSVNILSASFGLTENLEVGVARFDSDAPGASSETVINGKYLVLPETVRYPALTVGVVDISGELDPDGDPSVYLVLGKNLTPAAASITGEPVPPLRGYLGVGAGMYNGIFAGLDWAFSPRAKISVEYINELRIRNAIAESSVFNAALKFRLTDNLQGDIGLIDTEHLAFGLVYRRNTGF